VNFRRSVIIAELWRLEVARRIFFEIFALLGKKTDYGKIFKILFQKFSSRHLSTSCIQISWNLVDGKSVKSCVSYLTKHKNFAWLFSCRQRTDRAQNLPKPAPDNVRRVLLISSKSVHFRWRYSGTREHRQNAS